VGRRPPFLSSLFLGAVWFRNRSEWVCRRGNGGGTGIKSVSKRVLSQGLTGLASTRIKSVSKRVLSQGLTGLASTRHFSLRSHWVTNK
jgi:hypothetical protein